MKKTTKILLVVLAVAVLGVALWSAYPVVKSEIILSQYREAIEDLQTLGDKLEMLKKLSSRCDDDQKECVWLEDQLLETEVVLDDEEVKFCIIEKGLIEAGKFSVPSALCTL